jgi:hypothetical protein
MNELEVYQGGVPEIERLKALVAKLVQVLNNLLCEADCSIDATDQEREDFTEAVDAAMAAIAEVEDAAKAEGRA